MATFFSNTNIGYWYYTTNYLRGTLTGDVTRSGNTVTLKNMVLSITSVQGSSGTDTFTFTVNGTATSFVLSPGGGTNFGSHSLNNTSFNVSTTQTSATVGWSSSDGYTGSFTVGFPSGATPPTDLTLSDLVPGIDSFTATVSVSGWGQNPSSTLTDRYRELQVWTYSASGLVHPRRYQSVTGDTLSSSITVDNNSSSTDTPPLTISANTRYVIGLYATNGNASTGSQRYGDAYTLPPTPTSVSSSAQTYQTFNSVNCPITISYPADGGGLTKTLQYRLKVNGGSWGEWVDLTTVSTGSAGTHNGTLTLQTDAIIEMEVRSKTTAGASPSSVSTTITTLVTHEPPTFSNFDYYDTNAEIRALLGNDSYAIAGRSLIRTEVKVADKAIPFDNNYPVESYNFIADRTLTAAYSSSQDVYVVFDTPPIQSGNTIQAQAVDSLGATTTVSKSITLLSYAEPTLNLTVNRIDDIGRSTFAIAGYYSPLTVEGTEKNILTCRYRLTDENGTVVDWTTVTVTASGGEYTVVGDELDTDFNNTYLLEVQIIDELETVEASYTISAYEEKNRLVTPQYDIEVWTRDGNFVADISQYLTSDLSISWTLNDIEEVSFSVSLDAMELLRDNESLVSLLTPYAHDVRIRRNGKYVVGCQIVEANIKIDAEQIPTVQVKGTGYLNIFKDQYLSIPFAGYSYPVMAHRLIYFAQRADTLLRNPTGDIDASYWLSSNGTIAQTSVSKDGAGAVQGYSTGAQVMGSQMSVPANTLVYYDFWVSVSTASTIEIQERELITSVSTARTITTESISTTNTYTHITGSFTTSWDDSYFCVRNGTSGVTMRLDDVFIFRSDDEDALNNQYVGTIYGGGGTNSATSGYISDREFNYELQNVKDAVIDLVNMGEDNFDFEFTPDKKFKTYERKGSDRTDIEVMYPGNVYSLQVDRSAADMANKIQQIGSGIGDERLEVFASDTTSRQLYGTRESVVTDNNVSLIDTLEGLAQGELENRAKMTQNVTAVIRDGSINCGNIETGDVIPVKMGEYLGVLNRQLGGTNVPMDLLGGVEGWYLVKKISANISKDGVEQVTLTLEFEEGFDES